MFDDDGDSFPDHMNAEVKAAEEQHDAAEARGEAQFIERDAESIGTTQEAYERRAAMRDADLSDPGEGNHAPRTREEIRETIGGLNLAWWREEDGEAALSIASSLCSNIEEYLNHADALLAEGVTPGSMPALVTLDFRTGPLVISALQLLGLFNSDMRDDILPVLVTISDALPEATEEEKVAFITANKAIEEARYDRMFGEILKDMHAQPSPEQDGSDEPEHAPLVSEQDASLN